jgi:hypothetical protein
VKVLEKTDYYNSTSKKVVDFCIGFFGEIIGWGAVLGLQNLIRDFWTSGLGVVVMILLVIGSLVLSILLILRKRRYIGIGMIAIYGIIPLTVGACFVFFIISTTGIGR